MQDADLFMELAGIAGVFVGFGALIAVRGGGASGRIEIGYTRGMVLFGVLTIVAALAPVAISRYALTEHEVLALSSALVLVGWLVFIVLQVRTPEYRANVADVREPRRPRWAVVFDVASTGLYLLGALLAPLAILLGVIPPEVELALYFTTAVLLLLGGAWLLLSLVFAQRSTASA